jgi:hypothetical protein
MVYYTYCFFTSGAYCAPGFLPSFLLLLFGLVGKTDGGGGLMLRLLEGWIVQDAILTYGIC